jgi:hypothetical protein
MAEQIANETDAKTPSQLPTSRILRLSEGESMDKSAR